jgi:hypothetical protein
MNHIGAANTEAIASHCEKISSETHRHLSDLYIFYQKEALGTQELITLKPWLAIFKS